MPKNSAAPQPAKTLLFGIFSRQERWGLSWPGFFIVAFTLLITFGLFVLEIHPFLAETRPADSKIMVVEGWLNEYSLRQVAKEFKDGNYQQIYTTGGPVEGSGHYESDPMTLASVAAGRLKKFGVPPQCVQMVPARAVDRDRTFGSAVALRNYFSENKIQLQSFNLFTEGPHARRSQMLFQKAFGGGVKVGVIALASPDYDPKRWWHYSEGVREIIGETIAYAYAKFFFYPTEAERRGVTDSTPPNVESPKP
jgi:uncharacterized SAM-binding protein YcdF (DUF218 family)